MQYSGVKPSESEGGRMTTTIETTSTLPALQTLQRGKQWVNFNTDKAPFNPRNGKPAKANDPATWDTHEQAMYAAGRYPQKYAGVGREFLKEQNITGIDLDHCIDGQGNISEFAQAIIARLNSYTEYSPSGQGIHIWVYGTLPDNISPNKPLPDGIEMYDHARYFTITGKHLYGTPVTIEQRQDELTTLYNETKQRRAEAKPARPAPPANASARATTGDTPYGLKALEDECDQIARTGDGARNDQLNRSAFAIGQLIAGGEITEDTARRGLEAAADRAGLSYRETVQTLRSGIESGMKSPRRAPEKPHRTQDTSRSGAAADTDKESDQGERFACTDIGNAERFADRYGDKVRWCETWNHWMVFNGRCWERDKIGRVDQLAKATVRAIYHEVANELDDTRREKLKKHANASESNRAIRAMLERAKSELPTTFEAFNANIHLLNCNNGTLDLRNGLLQEHNPGDLLTRCLKVDYNPLAACPRWHGFIQTIFAGNIPLIDFIQQALGMCLTGDVSEQCLFICYGTGSNGKTTLLETVRIILAGYGLAANIETFQIHKGERINNDVAELYGARLVTASENIQGSRLNEAFIKKATGKEPLRARHLHENEFEFMPEFTIWLSVNHKPVVKDTSKGMWRRVHFIPFTVTIDGASIDKHMGEKLLEEAEGILAWLVRGCMTWYRQGLTVPDVVKQATQEYRHEMDTIARFLDEECVFADGLKTGSTPLLERYEAWCKQNGDRYDAKALKAALNERGYHSRRGTGGLWMYDGIALQAIAEDISNSDGSDGSDTKLGISTRGEYTRQNYPIPPSPTVTTNTFERKSAGDSDGTVTTPVRILDEIERESLLTQVSELIARGKTTNPYWRLKQNGYAPGNIPIEEYINRLRHCLLSNDGELQRLAMEDIDFRLTKAQV